MQMAPALTFHSRGFLQFPRAEMRFANDTTRGEFLNVAGPKHLFQNCQKSIWKINSKHWILIIAMVLK